MNNLLNFFLKYNIRSLTQARLRIKNTLKGIEKHSPFEPEGEISRIEYLDLTPEARSLLGGVDIGSLSWNSYQPPEPFWWRY